MLEVRPISRERTLLQWFEEQSKIDMNPSYQRRGDLWPDKHKKLLINSILNSYDIPKIYLADFTYMSSELNEHRKPYAVIDGKQRLSVFFSFLSDKLPLDDTPVYFDGEEYNLDGHRYSELKKRYSLIAKRFEQFTPTVMSVISDNLEEVQELFIRLNLNISISGAEKRNAMPGPLPGLIRKLSVHEFFRSYASFPINRGQDLDASAKFLYMEERQTFVNTNKESLDKFVSLNANKDGKAFKPIFRQASQNLDLMCEVFIKEDPILKVQAQLTIYYQLVKKYSDQYGHELREFIYDFERQRATVRREAAARARGREIKVSDAKLLDYNNFIRAPADRNKQAFMFTIMESYLKEFV
jgi:hypothetical protein